MLNGDVESKNGRFPHNPLRHLKMVAPSGTMSDSESSSSSNSDAEELARCREAAMPAWGLEQRPQGAEKPRSGRGPSEGRGSSPGACKGWTVGSRRLGVLEELSEAPVPVLSLSGLPWCSCCPTVVP